MTSFDLLITVNELLSYRFQNNISVLGCSIAIKKKKINPPKVDVSSHILV